MSDDSVKLKITLDGVPQVVEGTHKVEDAVTNMGAKVEASAGKAAVGLGTVEAAATKMSGQTEVATGRVVTCIGTFDAIGQKTAASSGRMASSLASVETAGGNMASGVEVAGGRMVRSLGDVETAVKGVIAAWGSWEILKAAKDATMFAANVEQADRALAVIANNMGMSAAEAFKYRDALRELGITTNSATNATAQFIRNGLPLDKLNQMGRAAQGAAISYAMATGEMISSSAALDKWVRALITGNVTELHTLGISVQMRDILRENREATGQVSTAVDTHHRHLMLLNESLEQSQNLLNLYEKSTDLASKKISSARRPIEELKLALGQLFLPELSASATAFYDLVSGGMKWVRQHTAEVSAARSMIKDFADGLVYATEMLGIYIGAVVIATAVTGGFAAGAGVFSTVLATLRMNLSLAGADAIIASTRIDIFGAAVATAQKTTTIGLLSIRTMFGMLSAFMLGWEFGKLLAEKFAGVRMAGVVAVYALMGAWNDLKFTVQEFWAVLSHPTNWTAAVNQIEAARAAWKKDFDKNFSEQMREAQQPSGSTNPSAKAYQDDVAAMAAGKAQKQKLEEEEKRRKADAAAEEARKTRELAERQATYDRSIWDAERAMKMQQKKDDLALVDVAGKEKLALLKQQMDLGLVTDQEGNDRRYQLEREAALQRLALLNDEAHAAYEAYDKTSKNPYTDRKQQLQDEAKYVAAVAAAKKAAREIDTMDALKPGEDQLLFQKQMTTLSGLNIQLLEAEGHYQAAAEARAAFQKSMPEYQRATEEIQKQMDAVFALNIEEGRRKDNAVATGRVLADIANQITAVNSLESAYALTVEDAANKRLDLYRKELAALQSQYDDISALGPPTAAGIQAQQQLLTSITGTSAKIIEQQKILSDRDAIGGARAALYEYAKTATDVGGQIKNALLDAFRGIEDALVDLVTKGKLSFKGMVDSITADLARMFIRQNVTGPLASGIPNLLAINGIGAAAGDAYLPGALGAGGAGAAAASGAAALAGGIGLLAVSMPILGAIFDDTDESVRRATEALQEMIRTLNEELDVRLLRAEGNTFAADLKELQIRQQREIDNIVNSIMNAPNYNGARIDMDNLQWFYDPKMPANQYEGTTRSEEISQSFKDQYHLIDSHYNSITSVQFQLFEVYKHLVDTQKAEMQAFLNKYKGEFDKAVNSLFPEETGYQRNLADAMVEVKTVFDQLAVAMPTTRSAMADYVAGLDRNSDAFASIMNVMDSLNVVLSDYDKTAKKAADATKTLREIMDSLTGGASSGASPEEQYFSAKARFESDYAKAKAGDTEAFNALKTDVNAFNSASQAYYASGLGYQQDKAMMTAAIQELLNQVAALPQNTTGGALGSLYAGAENSVMQVVDFFKNLFGFGVADSYPHFANGGIADGWSIVGEEGPEMVRFKSPGRVYTASQTAKMLKEDGGSAELISDLLSEIKALREEVAELKSHSAAGLRVAQAGFNGLLEQGEQNNKNSRELARTARRAAAA